MLDINTRVNASIRLVMDNSEQEEFVKYRRAAGKVMGYVFELLTPIFAEHPELTPEGLRKPDK